MRFVLLREAGGLGDVVRTFAVARGLKERFPDASVEYVVLAGYEALVRLSPDIDAVYTVSERERRRRDEAPDPARHAYLRRFGDQRLGRHPPARDPARRETARRAPASERVRLSSRETKDGRPRESVELVDLYCPAFRHEVETEGAVRLDRVELFCRAVGVEPSPIRIVIPAAEAMRARASILRVFGRKHGPLVGLAPYATHVARSWLGRARLVELARTLAAAGCRPVLFHSWKVPRPGRDEATARDIGAYPALRLPWPALAAHVAECDVVISADTGILHLAGAVGVPTLGLFGPTSGEIICRPYPTHLHLTSRDRPPGCRPPCYCRRSRGYEPSVCGRVGCELLRRLGFGDILDQLGRLFEPGRLAPWKANDASSRLRPFDPTNLAR